MLLEFFKSGKEKLMNAKTVIGKCASENCIYVCAVSVKRGIRVLPNKMASHFLSGVFVLQNAYLANT